jgi:hypothetical protein
MMWQNSPAPAKWYYLIPNHIAAILFPIRTPKPIRTLAVLPHLDRTVFAACRIELAVGGEADAPDWTVVAFMYI